MFRAVAFDVDGVLTKVNSIWMYMHKALGTWGEAKRNMKLFFEGRITYEEWALLDVALWKGVPYSKVLRIMEGVPLRDGIEEVFSAVTELGLKVIAISGGLMPLLEVLSRRFRFDKMYACELMRDGDKLNGQVKVHVTYNNKGEILRKACSELGIKPSECISVGDSEVDIPMFTVSGLSIAFNPSKYRVAMMADITIYSEDLKPLAELLRMICSEDCLKRPA